MSFNRQIVKEKALAIRINSLRMIHAAQSGHPGGSLSIADILATLYFGGHLKYDVKNPESNVRDFFIMSKGHASPALYSALALAGFYSIEETLSFRKLGSRFQGHIDRIRVPGVEMSTGSLGHGLSNALGIALAMKLDKSDRKVFALLSDGELQEGSTWEAAMAAAHYKAGNLIIFIDRNRIQLDGWTESTLALDSISEKFSAFNWKVQEIDGHDCDAINESLNQAYAYQKQNQSPVVIVAQTIKGKGVSFMEDQVKWHGSAPNDTDFHNALSDLHRNPDSCVTLASRDPHLRSSKLRSLDTRKPCSEGFDGDLLELSHGK